MGKVIWFTGLSGSGKTTLATALAKQLKSTGMAVSILDGDIIRATHNKRLGFSRKDIHKNNYLAAQMAKTEQDKVDFVLVPMISPYRSDRDMVHKIIGDSFVEVFVSTPLEECIKRDVKGLYKKALNGEIENFIGVSHNSPYEPPISPDVEIDTVNCSLDECVQKMFNYLIPGLDKNETK